MDKGGLKKIYIYSYMGLKAFYPGPVLYYMYKVYGDQQFYAKNFKSHDNKLYIYICIFV